MPKTTTIQIRLTDDEKAAFSQAADQAGISLSSWVRERLRAAAVRELQGAGRQVPFIEPLRIK